MTPQHIRSKTGNKKDAIRRAVGPAVLLGAFQIAFTLAIAAFHLAAHGWQSALVILATLFLNDLFLLSGLWIIYRHQIDSLRSQLLDLIAEVKHDHTPTAR